MDGWGVEVQRGRVAGIPFVRRTAEGRDGGGDQIEFGFWPLFRFLVGCLV